MEQTSLVDVSILDPPGPAETSLVQGGEALAHDVAGGTGSTVEPLTVEQQAEYQQKERARLAIEEDIREQRQEVRAESDRLRNVVTDTMRAGSPAFGDRTAYLEGKIDTLSRTIVESLDDNRHWHEEMGAMIDGLAAHNRMVQMDIGEVRQELAVHADRTNNAITDVHNSAERGLLGLTRQMEERDKFF